MFARKCAYKISRLESELITNVPKHITVINTTVWRNKTKLNNKQQTQSHNWRLKNTCMSLSGDNHGVWLRYTVINTTQRLILPNTRIPHRWHHCLSIFKCFLKHNLLQPAPLSFLSRAFPLSNSLYLFTLSIREIDTSVRVLSVYASPWIIEWFPCVPK